MTNFTTTIELREADERDYAVLDKALKQESFQVVRQYRVGTGEVLRARPEYNRKGKSLHDVTTVLLKALIKTGKKFSFTIVGGKAKK